MPQPARSTVLLLSLVCHAEPRPESEVIGLRELAIAAAGAVACEDEAARQVARVRVRRVQADLGLSVPQLMAQRNAIPAQADLQRQFRVTLKLSWKYRPSVILRCCVAFGGLTVVNSPRPAGNWRSRCRSTRWPIRCRRWWC